MTAEDAVKKMRNSKQAGKKVFTADEYLCVSQIKALLSEYAKLKREVKIIEPQEKHLQLLTTALDVELD